MNYVVEGHDETPDGYRDDLLYKGSSPWQVFKAIRAGLKEDMTITIKRWRR